MTREAKLLDHARSMPEAKSLVNFIETTCCDFWRDVLGLDIDRADFTSRALHAWSRGSIEGITLPPIALAAIIEASAHLNLNFDQIKTLRADIESINARLIARVHATKGKA